jgi:hypothetical protein
MITQYMELLIRVVGSLTAKYTAKLGLGANLALLKKIIRLNEAPIRV